MKGVRLGDMLRELLGTLRGHGMARRKGVGGGGGRVGVGG